MKRYIIKTEGGEARFYNKELATIVYNWMKGKGDNVEIEEAEDGE